MKFKRGHLVILDKLQTNIEVQNRWSFKILLGDKSDSVKKSGLESDKRSRRRCESSKTKMNSSFEGKMNHFSRQKKTTDFDFSFAEFEGEQGGGIRRQTSVEKCLNFSQTKSCQRICDFEVSRFDENLRVRTHHETRKIFNFSPMKSLFCSRYS